MHARLLVGVKIIQRCCALLEQVGERQKLVLQAHREFSYAITSFEYWHSLPPATLELAFPSMRRRNDLDMQIFRLNLT
jgi:hypothetical protein